MSPLLQKEPIYIMSKSPTKPFLYHHSTYSSLKRITEMWTIMAKHGKGIISLTTDPGRFLSPVPFMSIITIDGLVEMPYTDKLRDIAIPALYVTHETDTAQRARELGYNVYSKDQLPSEYKYIMKFVTHGRLFISENEYTVLADYLDLPSESTIYIHPKKLKRFKSSLSQFAFVHRVKSLEELVT